MFVVLAYDVQAKRVSKVRKTVKKYLFAAQESVFEGHLTEGALSRLKKELIGLIDAEKDSIVIYKSAYPGIIKKESIGRGQMGDHMFL